MGRWQTLNTGCARVTCQHFVVIMLLLLAAGGSVCAQEVDTARLRALAPFPHALLRRMSLSVGMGYAPLTGAAFFWDACDAAPTLADAGKFSKTSGRRGQRRGRCGGNGRGDPNRHRRHTRKRRRPPLLPLSLSCRQ